MPQVLILHGWSDTSKSFHFLADFLGKNGYSAIPIWLGDYISLDDDIRVADVAKRMGEVIDEMINAKQLDKSFDMIVHSTGGLVAREWLTSKYRDNVVKCPMKRLIMLAPANYGSKLAATGKSFLGRVVKGYNNWFHTGTGILNDLELASPYQWELAQRDVLVPEGAAATPGYYGGEDRVWPFVIVGTHPYTNLLRQIVNENGADGTVRVCAANLNTRGMTIDFRETDPKKMSATWESRLKLANGDDFDVPLAVLPTRTHGSIIDPDRNAPDNKEDIAESDAEKAVLGKLILEALKCDSFKSYQNIQVKWNKLTEETAHRDTQTPDIFHQYLQINFFVVDDFGQPVPDYFIEFFSGTSKSYTDANVYLHSHVIEDVKTNSQSAALRNIYIDRTDLMEGYYAMLPKGAEPRLYLSISAASPGINIKYFERERDGASGQITVHLEGDATQRWLKRNTTHFVKIIIPRMPNKNVFKVNKYK